MTSRTSRLLLTAPAAAFCAAGWLAGARPAAAIPAFARQHRLQCGSCHTHFPQLNDFGRRFLLNNFRIPGQEREAPLAWNRTVPLNLQLLGSLRHDSGGDEDVARDWEVQLQGGGLLTRRDAFYLHHHVVRNAGAGDLYEGWVQHAFAGHSNLNVRLGQFEQPLAFTPEIQRIPEAEYLVYSAPIGHNDFSLSSPTRGVMLSGGSLGDGVRYVVSVNQPRRAVGHGHGAEAAGGGHHGGGDPGGGHGHGARLLQDEHEEEGSTQHKTGVFARIQQQHRRVRLGLFGYVGRAEVIHEKGRGIDHFTRAGVDAEAECGKWRLYGLWLLGTHSDPAGEGEEGSLNGGFLGADYQFHPRYIAYARYDRAHARGPLTEGLQQGPTVGVSGLIMQNWRLALEYQRRSGGQNGYVLATRFAF